MVRAQGLHSLEKVAEPFTHSQTDDGVCAVGRGQGMRH